MAKSDGNRVAKEDRMDPVVIDKPKVGAPTIKSLGTSGSGFGADLATNPKPIGVNADQGYAKGKQSGVGQPAARKKRPMYTINKSK